MTTFLDEYFEVKTNELMHYIEFLSETNEHVLFAIDGRCGAGKTTFAEILADKLDCSILHMDDFFLQKQQRTEERYAQPGGNVDRERVDQVLSEFENGRDCTYAKFDCATMDLGEQVELPSGKILIVEGSYAMHPELEKHYAFSVFLDVDREDQKVRLKRRVKDEARLKLFDEKWIPLEEKYIEAFRIDRRCACYINTSMKEEEV